MGRPKKTRNDSERMLLRSAEEVAEYDAASLLGAREVMAGIIDKARVARAGWDPEFPSSDVLQRLRSLEADAARMEEVACAYRDRIVLLAAIYRDLSLTADERATANNLEARAFDLHHTIVLQAMTVWKIRMACVEDDNDTPEMPQPDEEDQP